MLGPIRIRSPAPLICRPGVPPAAHLGVEVGPARRMTAHQRGLAPIRIVKVEDRGLHEGRAAAAECRMLGIAVELDRPSRRGRRKDRLGEAFEQHRGRVMLSRPSMKPSGRLTNGTTSSDRTGLHPLIPASASEAPMT